MARIWLAEMTVGKPDGSTTVLRVCSGRGYTTSPAASPANTEYDPRLKQPVNITRSISSPGATIGQTKIALGNVVVANPDGGLDGWMAYSFDGRLIEIYSGDEAAAYPAGFTKEFVGTMDYPDFSLTDVTIKLRETQREMDAPIQILHYGGTNVLPAGLDGVAGDLKGKVIPLLYGRKRNFSPPCVNTSLLIYQISSEAVQTVTAVYDQGAPLTAGAAYTDVTDMMTNAPTAGQYRFLNTAGGSYIRLGSSPVDPPTVDAEQNSSTPANETCAQIFSQLVTRAGANLGNSSRYSIAAGDVAAVDAVAPGVIQLYIDREMTFIEAFDAIAATAGLWWGSNIAGKIRIKQLRAPSGTPVLSLTKNDVIPPLERLATKDENRGVPLYRVTCRYDQNPTVQTTNVALSVSDARRAVIGQEWKEATYTDTSVQSRYLLADALVIDTLYAEEADALTEAQRRQKMQAVQRHRFDVQVQHGPAFTALDLGDIIGLFHPRFSLNVEGSEEGQLFVLTGIAPDAGERRITLSLWGSSLEMQNRLFEDGVTRLFEDGTFRLTESS